MANLLQSPISSKLLVTKLKYNLEKITTRLSNSNNTTITNALAELNHSFKIFFETLKDPEFTPELFLDGDTARSEVYNNNLKSIYNDIVRFYDELKALSDAQIASFNYSQIVVNEITKRANSIASIVLDLNILSGFNRGDVIVAGDDFKTLDNIDQGQALSATRAESLPNGSGVGLARNGVQDVLSNAKIDVVPLAPTNTTSTSTEVVNTASTAGNIERFYEGNYYNFMGAARPEGGRFNIKSMMVPPVSGQDPAANTDPTTVYVELGASKETKERERLKIFDNDASTFWECEYLYRAPTPLIPDIIDAIVIDNDNNTETQDGQAGTVDINLEELERVAQQYDTVGRDLVIDLVVTLNSLQNVNFLAINPILFGAESFPEVEDIATASSSDGEFKTVDGWDRIKFPKTITPEANEFLTDSQLGASLSPSRSNYMGQGIYPFPVRQAKKIKIRLRAAKPVPCPYERTYVLMKNTVTTNVTLTTTTKKGLFG